MAEQINDGGPAFPGFVNDYDRHGAKLGELRVSGMTLRDYFAAAALTGILAGGGGSQEYNAELAFKYADALIAERERGGSSK